MVQYFIRELKLAKMKSQSQTYYEVPKLRKYFPQAWQWYVYVHKTDEPDKFENLVVKIIGDHGDSQSWKEVCEIVADQLTSEHRIYDFRSIVRDNFTRFDEVLMERASPNVEVVYDRWFTW